VFSQMALSITLYRGHMTTRHVNVTTWLTLNPREVEMIEKTCPMSPTAQIQLRCRSRRSTHDARNGAQA